MTSITGFEGEANDVDRDGIETERRRLVVDCLRASPTAMELDELAAEVARRESGGPYAPGDVVRRTQLSLYHRDVPKLADAGIVVNTGDGTLDIADTSGSTDGFARTRPSGDARVER